MIESSPLRKPVPPELWESFAPFAILAWRAWSYPLAGLWRDWIAILCGYWIFTALGSRTRAWPYVTGVVMGGLLLFYSSRQLPLTLAVLGHSP